MKLNILKVCTINTLSDSGASASIVFKDVLYKEFSKTKRINSQLWQGPLILLS